jgi:branched-chain amino acid transport system permease protein
VSDIASAVAATGRSRRWTRAVGAVVLVALLIVVPLYADAFWLNLGAFAFAAGIGAIGLTVLYGRVGQLSLAHAFFLAVGAYGYLYLGSPAGDGGWGVGLPPVLAVVGAVVLAGVAGLVFSPIAGRLRGLSLGVATIALIFIGEHALYNLPGLSGGFNGRNVPDLAIGGFELVGTEPRIVVAGVVFGRAERLWIVCGVVLILVALFTVGVLKSRVGRAFIAVRDGSAQAAALGVNVARTRAVGFLFSSMLAGLAGVLLALAFRRVVPEYWTLLLSLQYIAMVVLGGLGSIPGAVLGACFITALPLLLQRYGEFVPGLDTDPGAAFSPPVVAQLLFGVLIVVVLLIEPKGFTHLGTRLLERRRRERASHRVDDPGGAATFDGDRLGEPHPGTVQMREGPSAVEAAAGPQAAGRERAGTSKEGCR